MFTLEEESLAQIGSTASARSAMLRVAFATFMTLYVLTAYISQLSSGDSLTIESNQTLTGPWTDDKSYTRIETAN